MNGSFPSEVDALVCGGGPGGSTFASLMAKNGYRTVLFEREKFPRFHIGESLLPWNVPLFERIGVLAKLKACAPQVKLGARFYHQGSSLTRPVVFRNGIDQDHPSSFQVKRAEFDALLLDHARESGAEVFEEARVTEVVFSEDGSRARGVKVLLKGESEPRMVEAKVVVDATGRDALLSRHVGGRRRDPALDRSAAFAHYDTFRREAGPTGGDIVIVTTPDGWWWLIPFSDGSVSVGIVMPSNRFKERSGSVEKLFYLPEAHTDFLLAVIAEELGFVGVCAVISLFALLVMRAFIIGRQSASLERYFSALVAQGIGVWLAVQAVINMGVNMGLLPTKGLTLPLLSFGGSAIIANCLAVTLLLRIDFENRYMMKGGAV